MSEQATERLNEFSYESPYNSPSHQCYHAQYEKVRGMALLLGLHKRVAMEDNVLFVVHKVKI
jgi:hypothetical protein